MILLVIMLNTQYLVHGTTVDNSKILSIWYMILLVIMLNTQYLVHDTTVDNAQYSVFGT